MNPALALANWIRGESNRESALAEKRRKLEEHSANPPDSADPADHRGWRATMRALREDIADEEAALRIAKERRAEAERALREAEDRAEVASFLREKKAVRAEILKVLDLSTEIAKRLPAIQAHAERGRQVAEIAARLGLPPVVDAERELREIPGREIPASIRREMAWVDEKGERASQLRDDGSGRMVPYGPNNHGQYKYKEVEVVQSHARTEPPRMPERLAEAIRLVGLKGESLHRAR